ncbi:MAG: methylated-DNA--[protein]-cysteine S-methyltransferase [Gammaproteobacteria bacterium]|nr:methylated-DNA--[protein]-cysteine S-methyltransferase [Gammaproteobacteria bacterium]MBQ0839223.1 methylated-DNA--[protein]-cysteine S-methyltransferase [Gammaproteobacteria bacterium]
MPNTEEQSQIAYASLNSPIGRLTILADDKGITEIRFPNNSHVLPSSPSSTGQASEYVERAIDQLQAYFDGHLKDFDLPLSLGGTDFQQGVWAQLQTVRYGTTASYGQIAAAINKPKAARAVGMANNKNRIPIVIPCHRIIGSNGSLTGFAGGLDTKRWLLAHEASASGRAL